MKITREQLIEMIMEEAGALSESMKDIDVRDLMNPKYASTLTPRERAERDADEDALRDVFKELTGKRPANSEILVWSWSRHKVDGLVNDNSEMKEWMLTLPDLARQGGKGEFEARSLDFEDLNALTREKDRRDEAEFQAERTEDAMYADYDLPGHEGMGRRQNESVLMTVGQFRKLIREAYAEMSADAKDYLADLRDMGYAAEDIIKGLRMEVYDDLSRHEMDTWMEDQPLSQPWPLLKAWFAHIGADAAEDDLDMLLRAVEPESEPSDPHPAEEQERVMNDIYELVEDLKREIARVDEEGVVEFFDPKDWQKRLDDALKQSNIHARLDNVLDLRDELLDSEEEALKKQDKGMSERIDRAIDRFLK